MLAEGAGLTLIWVGLAVVLGGAPLFCAADGDDDDDDDDAAGFTRRPARFLSLHTNKHTYTQHVRVSGV